VDPVRDVTVARGFDLRASHPLQHCTMVGVDLVARSQGGGMWDNTQGQTAGWLVLLYFSPVKHV